MTSDDRQRKLDFLLLGAANNCELAKVDLLLQCGANMVLPTKSGHLMMINFFELGRAKITQR